MCKQAERQCSGSRSGGCYIDKTDADQWCSVRKGCANDPFPPQWVVKFCLLFIWQKKLNSIRDFHRGQKINKYVYNQSVLWTVWLAFHLLPPPSKACKNVFMHITKSLIKSTSNCRHRNQSQLPHPRRSADCESDCESSNPPRSEWKIANMRKVEKDKRNATEGDGSSAGPGESGALFINLC